MMDNFDYMINSLISQTDDQLLVWVEFGLHISDNKLFMNKDLLEPKYLVKEKDFKELKERIVYLSREISLKKIRK